MKFISRRSSRQGFTLVELLIVIAVIAVLAAITVVAYQNISQKAQVAAIQADLSQAATELESYKIDNSGYPPDQTTVASLLKLDSSIALTYAVNNTASAPSYCLIAAQGSQQLSVSSANNTPSTNGCVINLATDPRATTYAAAGWQNNRWFGASPATGTYTLVNGAVDGPLGITTYARKTWTALPSTLSGCGDSGHSILAGATMMVVTPGDIISASGYVRASRQVNVNFDVMMYNASGVLFAPSGWSNFRANSSGNPAPGVNGGYVASASGAWTRVGLTLTVPAGVAGISFVLDRDAQSANGAAQWQVGDTFDATALMVTKGSTLYNYADGNSPGWSWSGTPNSSTSFGPAL